MICQCLYNVVLTSDELATRVVNETEFVRYVAEICKDID